MRAPDDIAADRDMADYSTQIAPVITHCGLGVARTLVDQFGGARLRVPMRWPLPPGHALEAMGDHAHQLVGEFGGETLYVPKSLYRPEALLRRAEAALAEAGGLMTRNDLALRLGVTRKTARLLMRRIEAKGKAGQGEGGGRAAIRTPARAKEPTRQIDLEEWLRRDTL